MNNKICPLMSTAEKEVECKKEACKFWFEISKPYVYKECSIVCIARALKAK